MKKNLKKMFACTLAMSTLFSMSSLSVSAFPNPSDPVDFSKYEDNGNLSEEFKEFILNSEPNRVINERCKAYIVFYSGTDENGKKIYTPGIWNDAIGGYTYTERAGIKAFDEEGNVINANSVCQVVWFDENGVPEKIVTPHRIPDVLIEGNMVYKAFDITTGEDIIVVCTNDVFEGNVVAKCGDTNCDGTVDVRDVTSINQHIIKENILPDYADTVADVNDDGNIDISDLGMLKKYIVKMIDSF